MGMVHRDCGGRILYRQVAIHYTPIIEYSGNGCYDTDAQDEDVHFTDDCSPYCETCEHDVDDDECVDENAEETE
jgi:hypothetical protein